MQVNLLSDLGIKRLTHGCLVAIGYLLMFLSTTHLFKLICLSLVLCFSKKKPFVPPEAKMNCFRVFALCIFVI